MYLYIIVTYINMISKEMQTDSDTELKVILKCCVTLLSLFVLQGSFHLRMSWLMEIYFEDPWSARQDVNSTPAAYMGWFYKTNQDCNLTGLGLAFNGTTGNIFGRTPVYDEDDPLLSTECEAIKFGVQNTIKTSKTVELHGTSTCQHWMAAQEWTHKVKVGNWLTDFFDLAFRMFCTIAIIHIIYCYWSHSLPVVFHCQFRSVLLWFAAL